VKAQHVVTKGYGQHAVAKNVRRVVPIDDLVNALYHAATAFHFVGLDFGF
jgi:hypothetical protein